MEEFADVIVVGGGIAGLVAALSAAERGADVLLVSATPLGSGGDSAIASGGFAVAANRADGDSPSTHRDDTLRSGHGLATRAVVEQVTENGPAMLERLTALGARFARHDNGEFAFAPIPGHSRPRSVRCEGGGTGAVMGPLIEAVRRSGIRIREDVFVRRLRQGPSGRVTGVDLLDREGRPSTEASRTTILAAGGLGQLYAHTSNAEDIFGSGYALALHAGCSVVDLEFIQFTPTALVYPTFAAGMSPGGALMAQPGVTLRNANGERFMRRYDPERGECTTRDVLSRAIDTEVREGRGTSHGGVYLDLSGTTREAIFDISGRFLRAMDAGGFDPFEQRAEVAPETHFCMGGVVIDETGETELPGLFAAGEVAAGMHGANRLNSNALTEAAVMGWVAGESAAKEAAAAAGATVDLASSSNLDDGAPPRMSPLPPSQFFELRNDLQRVVQVSGGVLRSVSDLLDGISRVDAIEKSVLDTGKGSARDALEQMCLVARVVLYSALRREESRGAHYRADFPQTDAVTSHTRVRLVGGELDVATLPAGTGAEHARERRRALAGNLADRQTSTSKR